MSASTPTTQRSTHRRWVLGLLAGGLLLASQASGETLVFRDRARGQADGKILVEFEDLLFVVLDGEPAQFVSRAELAAIVDKAGQRHERPALGTFGRVGGPAPLAALTDVEGQATLTRTDSPAKELGGGAGPVFLRGNETLTTGEAGLIRWVFPSGAVAKQAPQTTLNLPGSVVREELGLESGELFLEARHRPLEVVLEAPITARLAAGGQATLRRKGSTAHVQQHVGKATLAWPAANFSLEAGLGAELVKLQTGGWRVTADPANHGPFDLVIGGETIPLRPGETRVIGAKQRGGPGEVWRLLRSNGDLLLRRGRAGAFTLVQKAQRDRLVLGPGDALRTGPAAGATLIRADGASVKLEEAARLDVEPVLALARGALTIDALETPVRFAAPGGDATLRLSVTRVVREVPELSGSKPGAEPAQVPRPSRLALESLGGKPSFPLDAHARVILDARASLSVASTEAGAKVQVATGQALVRSQAPPRGVDPGFEVELGGDEALELPRVKPGDPPALSLPGDRRLSFAQGTVGVRLRLQPKVVGSFPNKASIELAEGLSLALARAGEHPELRFRSGPRIRLEAPYEVRVENPTIRVSGRGGRTATCKLEGDLSVTLREGGQHTAAALGLRAGDRLELPSDVISSLRLGGNTHRFHFGQRRLWIENGAPAVQARLGDAGGTMFLSMPETPGLGLRPKRPITVLATESGEFVVLDDANLDLSAFEGGGLSPFSGDDTSSTPNIARDRIPDLLDVPPPDSPSGP